MKNKGYKNKNELSWCPLIRSVNYTHRSGKNTMKVKNIAIWDQVL
jgi:hypothetical protein